MALTTFSAFKSRNYRLYFTGQSISLIGTWMQKTAVSWVIYSQTHSELMLGVTLFASLFPSFILSFIGGMVSDRYDRYRVLLVTQFASMAQAVLLVALVWSHPDPSPQVAAGATGLVWSIIGLSALLGAINAFDVPARQALVYDMVDDKALLPNALALNSSMVNLSRLIGPALAGLTLEGLGDVFCFGLNALSFLAVIGSLLMMRLPKRTQPPQTANVAAALREGLAYIRKTPAISYILVMLSLISLLVLPYSTLIPVYARDVFRGDASTLGVIDGAIGLGAFAGALFLASLKPGRNIQQLLAVNTLVFGTGLVLFSHIQIYWLSLVCAIITGFGMMSQITISNTLIQTTAAPGMRGRVISFYAMAFFGMQPVGGLLVGWVSNNIGVPDTVMCQGFIALAIGLLHFRFLKKERMRRLQELKRARGMRMLTDEAPTGLIKV